MLDRQQIERIGLEEALRRMPAAAVVAEAPSGKIILINERARRMLERNAGWSRLPEPEGIGDFGELKMFRPDGRPVEMEEWPLVRSIRSGEEVRDEEQSYLLADGSRLTIRSDSSPIHDDEGRIVAGVLIVRDVTEHKRSEEDMRASEERFRATFEQAAVGIAHNAPDGRWLRVNRKLCEILGYSREELLRKKFQDVTHPDDLATDVEQTRRLLAGAIDSFSMEKRYTKKDGSTVWGNLTVSLAREASGEPDYFIAVIEDITERKRAEEELKWSHRRIEDILESITDESFAVDREWRYTYINERALDRVRTLKGEELTREDLLGRIVWEAVPEVVGTVFYDKYQEAVREQKTVDFEAYSPLSNRWIEAHAYPSEEGLSVYCQDVTERKRAEEKLRESSRRVEEILESVTDAFYAMDAGWRFTYLNERAVRFASQLAGEDFTREGLLGRTLWETLPAIVGTSIENEYRRAVREQRTAVFEYPYPGGGPIFEVHAYPSEQGLSIYFQDATERKRTEEASRARTLQQAVVADLGLRALANDSLGPLLDDTVALVARTLDVECCRVVEVLPGGEEFLLRAGFGWQEGVVGSTAEIDPQVAYTLSSSGPVIFEDLEAETRFEPSPMLRAHGVVSGITVLIPGREEPYGALGAHTVTRRTFSEEDANFLQAVANVLATVIERDKAERELGEVREAERSRIARDLHDKALQDLAYAMTQAQTVRAAPAGGGTVDRTDGLTAALKRVEQQLRGAIYDLRLEAEHDKPFSELLLSLIELHRTMAPDLDFRVDLRDVDLEGPLKKVGRETLRIVGEALTNARRHSGARNIGVSVSTSGGRLLAEVSDDGRGTDPSREPSPAGGMGIKGMRERARALGGELKIQSEPAMGTKVIFKMALEQGRKRPEGAVRVLLVEDHVTVREAVAASFEWEAGFEVVGQAGSLGAARRLLAEGIPVDVAVVDLGLPDGHGGDLIEDLRAANPEAQALVLSVSLDRAETARAVQSGAAGVLHKTAHLDEVVGAVERLRAGETLMSLEEVVELLRFAGTKKDEEYKARQAIESLTPREIEVLQKLAGGLDSDGIAESLNISVRTQRNHVASILAKLGVHSQLQALVFAVRHGAVKIS
ncbi:MAG TPA: PAS domain S-box protein [Rubrobacteraceae bacterium]|nr:PAS domain S-box protein [Rubrobacteraceae bacterium]